MKIEIKKLILVFLLGVAAGILSFVLLSQNMAAVTVQTIFSPENGDEIIAFIDSARTSIDIEMYVFTSNEILQALKRASDRGVTIRIILEKRVINSDNERIFNELKINGIDVKWASQDYRLTHAKFIIVDDKAVLVGSHNFSNSAMRENREASVIIRAEKIVNEFKEIFEEDWIRAK